jgi:ribonuclease J
MTELELQKEAKAIIEKEKYCFVMCSSTNIDRIAAFYHAAKDAGRMVLCDAYQKDVLDIVTRTRHSDYYDFTGVLVNDPNNKAQQAKLFKDGAVFIVRSGNWRNYKGFFEKKNGLLVYSMWHGYLHGGAKNSQLAKIVESTGTRHIKLHTSGHATVEALEKVISLTNPDMIIPIHSEKPERMNGIDHGTSTIQYLVDGENLEL